jgi:hypothetical protein
MALPLSGNTLVNVEPPWESNPRPTHYEAGRVPSSSVRDRPASTSGAGQVEAEPLRTAPNCYPNCSRGELSTVSALGPLVLAQAHTAERESALNQAEQQDMEGARESRSVSVPSLGSPALGPALLPVPLVLAALLVGAVGARVALAPSRSDAVGALAATVETWIFLGRGGQLGISLGTTGLEILALGPEAGVKPSRIP